MADLIQSLEALQGACHGWISLRASPAAPTELPHAGAFPENTTG
jgi:hypothetical protein